MTALPCFCCELSVNYHFHNHDDCSACAQWTLARAQPDRTEPLVARQSLGPVARPPGELGPYTELLAAVAAWVTWKAYAVAVHGRPVLSPADEALWRAYDALTGQPFPLAPETVTGVDPAASEGDWAVETTLVERRVLRLRRIEGPAAIYAARVDLAGLPGPQ